MSNQPINNDSATTFSTSKVSASKNCPFKANKPPPFDALGLFTYLRTYARRHDDNDPNSTIETWEECLNRIVLACNSQLGVGFTEEEMHEFFSLMYNVKCLVAGRFLWQLGTNTVERAGLTSLQNCAATVIDEPIEPFLWAMNMLMLGSGVGYRVLPEDVAKLPEVKHALVTRRDTNDADFIVPDSREGWIKLLGRTLKAHFYSGKSFTYSCVLLRSRGATIKGFGGVASGPDSLCDGITKISKVLNARAGKKIRPVDALDMMNIIGEVVVSGNVRRSAQICIGDVKDKEYMRAKRWDLGPIPNYRCYSNNSVQCNDINDILDDDEFWEGYQGKGEPYGLINMRLSRSCGRLGDTQYPDPDIQSYNPCAEIGLSKRQTCCLAELFLPNISTKEELIKCATYLYRACKHSLTLPCRDSIETERIVHADMRIGIGVTGYLQSTEEQKSWLSDCYEHLRNYDKEYSRKHGFPTSIKLTAVKPSGTMSLLGATTPGVNPGYAQFFKRRVRLSSESPLVELAKKHNYPCEYVRNFDGSVDPRTMIVAFPCKYPDGTVFADKCSAIEQLEYIKRMQTDWADNAVSSTCCYKPEELPAIKEWLRENYNNNVKTVSFLLHSGHGFQQAPYEPITEEEYNEFIQLVTPITDTSGICTPKEDENIGQFECVGGSCPVR